ncbi:hypothetical protein PMAYCL1PPCAC_02538 [Pristionchus mayeri]|uniref:Uncharacterized protein n=1 Tax=Pristionchus mayeri TaxID=1317129 RepID=A0AAN5C0J5_9BILA|nr:hypothetical protein PMAYCL1PPCAC_02538 [Pristionchus mayeri]
MWLQIPYFCGQHPFCSEIGSRQALEQAKRTLVDKYLIVGVSDRIRDTVAMLEATIPSFFRGALKHFDSLDETRAHLRNTRKKVPPSSQTLYLVTPRKSTSWRGNSMISPSLTLMDYSRKRRMVLVGRKMQSQWHPSTTSRRSNQ